MQTLTLTKDIGQLTIAQRNFYEHNGFLVIPRLVPVNILDKCSKRFDDYASGVIPKGSITMMKDIVDRNSINKIQDIVEDKIFREYFAYKELLDVVESFIGPNIMAMHSMLIAKPPDIGSGTSRHPPHQDLFYFPFRPAYKIVASWTAIEKCNKQNGCLYVYAGSHRYNLMKHSYTKNLVNKMYYEIQNFSKPISWIDVEMEPGDTLFFHPLLVHGSGTNTSNHTRKAISCHYADADCYYIDVEKTIQQNISDEVTNIVKQRFNYNADIKYKDIWKFKSILIRGIRSSL
ncbi:PREDICTED: phytanoyl-CoA dioxygenase, peroxisomal-like [Ceratosolen solmsi marchali]|uniref:phytanoyl-CoA dioxygenase n=1 Tax=Ceratosolen solmsi marchali TaxID=326594 RepID=A0AAJ6VLQ8_9HYME|nr:PREDICTED: phytanoyl-CoA dioxygenase, peroxisomal-like [Ceratosolen solmsi marchali]